MATYRIVSGIIHHPLTVRYHDVGRDLEVLYGKQMAGKAVNELYKEPLAVPRGFQDMLYVLVQLVQIDSGKELARPISDHRPLPWEARRRLLWRGTRANISAGDRIEALGSFTPEP